MSASGVRWGGRAVRACGAEIRTRTLEASPEQCEADDEAECADVGGERNESGGQVEADADQDDSEQDEQVGHIWHVLWTKKTARSPVKVFWPCVRLVIRLAVSPAVTPLRRCHK